LLVKQKKRIILASLNSIGKLDKLEAYKQKEYKEKTRREAQLPVPSGETLALTNNLLVYSLIDFPNPFDNPSLVALLANYNFLDPF
jgi:hypothetical protein